MIVFGLYISMTVFWLSVALIFLIIEVLTIGLATIWFAVGAFVALIASFFDASIPVQIAIFLIVSICLLVFTRKIFVEKLKTGSEKTNVDAIIGEKAVVINPILPYEVGRVKINGQSWSAVAENPQDTIEVNQLVKVIAVEGVKVIVSPIKNN